MPGPDLPDVHASKRAGPAVTLVGLLVALVVGLLGASPAAGANPASPAPGSTPWFRVDGADDVRIALWFGWSSTCPHCTKARPAVDQLAADLPWLEVHSLQVDDGPSAEENVETLLALADLVGEEIRGVPVFIYANRLRVGFLSAETTGVELRAELVAYREEVLRSLIPSAPPSTAPPAPTSEPSASATSATPTGTASPSMPAPTDASASPSEGIQVDIPLAGRVDAATLSLPVLAVMLGGLDAFNPCAMSVLLFLMSVLVGARDRRRILLVGGTFVLVSGIVYFLLMAAWLNLFLAVGALRVVTLLAGAAAVVAALINIKDYAWLGRGPSLVIPSSARPTIFGRILDLSEATALPALLATTILVAAVANAYEMLCTGGFPVVFTRVLTLNDLPVASYYAYLGLYNVVYVLPLLAIVLVFGWTLGTGRIREVHARRLKLLSGLLMLGFGLLLLFQPDRLGDLVSTLLLFGGAVVAWLAVLGISAAREASRARPPARPAGRLGP